MGTQGAFDVVLFGYRNDVARARVLEYLDRLPVACGGPTLLDRNSGLPQRLFAALQHEPAEQLRATLEALGAQVALLDVTTAGSPPRSVPLRVGLPHRAPPGRRARPFLLLLLVALGALAYLWHQVGPAAHPDETLIRLAPQRATLHRFTRRAGSPEAVILNEAAIKLTAAGNFRDAVGQLQRARRLAPAERILTRNLQTVLFNWGVAELRAHHLAAAGDHLQAAAQLGERPDVLRALGVTHLREEEYVEATANLERALRMQPADPHTMLALAEAYLKQDKRPQALDLLQRAKEAGARSTALDRRIQRLSREVDAEWDFVALESPHFRVSFADDEDHGAVQLVLDTLEDAYEVVGRKFNFYPDEQTLVVLYTRQDFHAVTQTPDWAGAAFDGRIKLPVRGLTPGDARLPRIVRHEYAHSLVGRLSAGRCPVWLNEGLAVWAEEAEDGEREAWAENKLADQALFTLGELNSTFARLPAARAEVAYAESYLAVRALVDDYGPRKITALLAALQRHRKIDDAFAAIYPDDFGEFHSRLLRQLGG